MGNRAQDRLDKQYIFSLRIQGIEYQDIANRVGCSISTACESAWSVFNNLSQSEQNSYTKVFNRDRVNFCKNKRKSVKVKPVYEELVFDFGCYVEDSSDTY